MLIEENKYLWSKGQPEDIELSDSPFSYNPHQVLRIYRFEGDGEITIFADEEMTVEVYQGGLPYEPTEPISCDGLTFIFDTPVTVHLIAETGILKTVLLPYLNTTEGMEVIHNDYNDDSTYSTAGLADFKFNGSPATTLYLSSNHWIGMGVNSEQLKILRRDGCSTAMYRQTGETTNGLQFLKYRFEGYTVYRDRVEANRLIYELLLLSNNDMFLNIIQTPTNAGNLGYSELVCNGKTIPLTLADGSGGGTQVSFYHQDIDGKEWAIDYAMYEERDTFSSAYLLKQSSTFYTIVDEKLVPCEINSLTAAMFLKYGFEELPSSKMLTPLVNPEIYLWKAGASEELLKMTAKAYPYPQTLEAVADMSHIYDHAFPLRFKAQTRDETRLYCTQHS